MSKLRTQKVYSPAKPGTGAACDSGDEKLSTALSKLSLTFSQLLQSNVKAEMDQLMKSPRSESVIIEDLKKLVVSRDEDCKLASDIGIAILSKYQELHDQNTSLKENLELEISKRIDMLKKEQDQNNVLKREIQALERKLFHATSMNESLELELKQTKTEYDHYESLKQLQRDRSHLDANGKDDNGYDVEYYKSQLELSKSNYDLSLDRIKLLNDKYDKVSVENESLRGLEKTVSHLKEENRLLLCARTENGALKSSLKQSMDQMAVLKDQLKYHETNAHAMEALKKDFECMKREKDEMSALLEDCRVQLELTATSTVGSFSGSSILPSTISTMNMACSSEISLDREISKLQVSNEPPLKFPDEKAHSIPILNDSGNLSPTKKMDALRQEKRQKAKELLLSFRAFGRRANTVPEKKPLNLKNYTYEDDDENDENENDCLEEQRNCRFRIESFHERLKMTDVLKLNRKLRKAFDMEYLVDLSNTLLKNLCDEICKASLSLSSSSSNLENIPHQTSFFHNFCYHLLTEQANLRILLNEYAVAYVESIKKKSP